VSERVEVTLGAELPQAGAADAPESDEQVTHRIGVVRLVIAGSVVCLALLAIAGLLDGQVSAFDALDAALVIVLGCGLLLHDRLSVSLGERRRSRETGMTRILQGLSRSRSPDAVVDAIVAELRQTSGADHVVVARVRRPDQVIEVTLVAARANVPASKTWLRPEVGGQVPDGVPTSNPGAPDASRPRLVQPRAVVTVVGGQRPDAEVASTPVLPPPNAPARAAAEDIARRVRAAYGLPHTLTEPLVAEREFLGALMLSRRTREPWGETEQRLLGWAALEVSAAFARAYALEEAERESHLDALTGLPNRRYFDELLAIMGPRRRETDSLAILMVDVDRFKQLNDRHGHAAGDAVLRDVAGAIARTLRAEDTPVRYGGEEFAVILRRASAPQAAEVAERIRQAVADLGPSSSGVDAPVTVSVGVAVAGEEDEMSAVIERSDQALYRAKRRGRDRVEVG
jgi:diguanylate cyclase (GGDEF)-like protein